MAFYLKDLPFTEEGKKLNLSDEDRERFRMVYKRKGDGWVLHDIWGEGGDYGDDCIVVPLQSVYTKSYYIDAKKKFANVHGTTDDPPAVGKEKNWLLLWETMYLAREGKVKQYINCCTDGFMYAYDDSSSSGVSKTSVSNCNCHVLKTREAVGGHVIIDDYPHPEEIAKNEVVYILPICKGHNNRKEDGYMITRKPTFVVELRYGISPYLSYLAQHPLETHEKI